jgi:competence protein ComEA
MGTWLDRNRGVVFGLLSVVTVAGAGMFYFRQPTAAPIEIATAAPTATVTPQPEPTATLGPVRVYITGAVQNEDVYFLPAGSIIKDVVEAAGGFIAEADHTRINLAQEVKDQQQIHVPRRNEVNAPPPVQDGAEAPAPAAEGGADAPVVAGGVINLNTATIEQLDTLPGVGPAIAKRIIEYRDGVGGFSAVEEITQVSGIGEATFAKIKGSIRAD